MTTTTTTTRRKWRNVPSFIALGGVLYAVQLCRSEYGYGRNAGGLLYEGTTKQATISSEESGELQDLSKNSDAITDAAGVAGGAGDESGPPSQGNRSSAPSQLFPSDKRLVLNLLNTPGFSNQMSCFQAAAVLSVQYNRTLALPSKGYRPSPVHGGDSLRLDEVFDLKGLKRNVGKYVVGSSYLYTGDLRLSATLEFDPTEQSPVGLVRDANEGVESLVFPCSYAYSLYSFPLSSFPQQQHQLLPFNRRYRRRAERIIDLMRDHVGYSSSNNNSNNSGSDGFRFLGLQIRRGDRETWPVVDCSVVRGYSRRGRSKGRNGEGVSYCGKQLDGAGRYDQLTWTKRWETVIRPEWCERYDAVFVATNDRVFVEDQLGGRSGECRLLMIGDLLDVSEGVVPDLITELLVLAMATRVVPSFPTSITDLVLRLRFDDRVESLVAGVGVGGDADEYEYEYEKAMNRTYWSSMIDRRDDA